MTADSQNALGNGPQPGSGRPQFSLLGTQLASEGMMVDFLGGLVPGIVFLVGATVALALPVVSLHAALMGSAPSTLPELLEFVSEAVRETPSTLWLGVFSGVVLFSYMVGHIFYRHDVKEADRSSFRRLLLDESCRRNAKSWRAWRRFLWERLGVDVVALVPFKKRRADDIDEDWLRENLGCSSEDRCEFPYPSYHRYLEKRGLGHLLPMVLENRRSKTYINLLKVRLHFHAPHKVRAIIKNEAHVRLAASTWYVAKLLIIASLFGLLIGVGSVVLVSWTGEDVYQGVAQRIGSNLFALLAPGVIMLASLYAWWTIRGFLHYQRLREVFFVLETAYTAFRGDEDLLEPPFELARTRRDSSPIEVAAKKTKKATKRGKATRTKKRQGG